LERPEIQPATTREDVFRRGATQFSGGILGYHGIEFSNLVGYRPLEMDLYLPAKTTTKYPLVIWIHGGGWSRGDARTSGAFKDWPAVLASLAARGFVVASVDYRMSSEAHFPAAIQDVKASVRFLRANAAKYNIDPDQILVWGGSAGGHLAALAATTCGIKAFEPQPSTGRLTRAEMASAAAADANTSDCVQGAIAWYGLFDLNMDGSANVIQFLGCKKEDCMEPMKQASPLTYLSPSAPPMFLLHGTADKTVSPKQTEMFAAALKQVHVPVQTLYIPGADHGWMGATPDSTRTASQLAIEKTFAYLDSTTKHK
jgi:acetyl esterase/lipase